MTLCIIHNILTGDIYTNLGRGCEYENMRIEGNYRKTAANDLRDIYINPANFKDGETEAQKDYV